MINLIQRLIDAAAKFNADLSREQWIYVFAILVAAGFMLMRGFGSRTKY